MHRVSDSYSMQYTCIKTTSLSDLSLVLYVTRITFWQNFKRNFLSISSPLCSLKCESFLNSVKHERSCSFPSFFQWKWSLVFYVKLQEWRTIKVTFMHIRLCIIFQVLWSRVCAGDRVKFKVVCSELWGTGWNMLAKTEDLECKKQVTIWIVSVFDGILSLCYYILLFILHSY